MRHLLPLALATLSACAVPPSTAGADPADRVSLERDLVAFQVELFELGEGYSIEFSQRIEPGMSQADVVAIVGEITANDPYIDGEPSGEPSSREFAVVEGVRVDTWLYRFDFTLSQSRPDLDFVLTFHDGSLVGMQRRG